MKFSSHNGFGELTHAEARSGTTWNTNTKQKHGTSVLYVHLLILKHARLENAH